MGICRSDVTGERVLGLPGKGKMGWASVLCYIRTSYYTLHRHLVIIRRGTATVTKANGNRSRAIALKFHTVSNKNSATFIICPTDIASMGQVIKSLASFCLSVCRHSYTVATFTRRWWNFAQLLWTPKVTKSSLGVNVRWLLFCLNFHPIMHFCSMEGPSTAVTRPEDVLWRLIVKPRVSEAAIRKKMKSYNPLFSPKTQKWKSCHCVISQTVHWT